MVLIFGYCKTIIGLSCCNTEEEGATWNGSFVLLFRRLSHSRWALEFCGRNDALSLLPGEGVRAQEYHFIVPALGAWTSSDDTSAQPWESNRRGEEREDCKVEPYGEEEGYPQDFNQETDSRQK